MHVILEISQVEVRGIDQLIIAEVVDGISLTPDLT